MEAARLAGIMAAKRTSELIPLCHPLTRANTGDNPPAVIHTEMIAGDKLRLQLLAKGGGCENKNIQYSLPMELDHLGRADRNLDLVLGRDRVVLPGRLQHRQ